MKRKKTIGIFVCMLVLATAVSITATDVPEKKLDVVAKTRILDQVDQQQSKIILPQEDGQFSEINKLNGAAQSFTPTLRILTRIKLKLTKDIGIYAPQYRTTANLIVSIRSELNGEDLVTAVVTPEEVPDAYNNSLPNPYEQIRLVEVDFDDLSVEMGETYYIICELESEEGTGHYCWFVHDDTAYDNGFAWYHSHFYEEWFLKDSTGSSDYCFITFGKTTLRHIAIES